MHFSLFLGQAVDGPEDDAAAIDLGIEQAHYADEHGFAAVYSGEQHFNNYEPYGDGFSMAAYLAGQLKSAYVGLSVVPLIIHHPLLFVQRANLLDQLSKGKCIIGISGGRPFEGATFHVAMLDPAERARLFDAKLELAERAWAHKVGDPPLVFDTGAEQGAMGERPGQRIMPESYRAGHPLFAIGTNTPSKIVDAGRSGQLVHLGPFGLEGAAEMAALYRGALEAGGHNASTIEDAMSWLITTKLIMTADTDDEAWAQTEEAFRGPLVVPPWIRPTEQEKGLSLRDIAALPTGPLAPAMGMPESMSAYLHRIVIVGSPETVARQVAAYGDKGASHLHIRFAFGSAADPEVYRRSLELFATEVMPKVGSTTIAPPSNQALRAEHQRS